MSISMSSYDPTWPASFRRIAAQLRFDLMSADINFVEIIHFGSTSIPLLNAKPCIDIMITLPPDDFYNLEVLPRVCAALRDGDAQGGYYWIGDGGIHGRWSFKLGIRDDEDGNPVMIRRSVYFTPDCSILHRTAVAFRDCLRDENNAHLRDQYGELKWDLVENEYVTIYDYSDLKTPMIRRILSWAGVTDMDITLKENLRARNWPEHLIL